MNTEFPSLNVYLKDVALKYLFFIFCIFLSHFIYYWYQNMVLYQYLTLAGTILHASFMIIPYRLKYESIKRLIPVYLTFISLILYPFVFLYWQIGQITAFMWYLVVPFGSMVFLSTRSVVFWTVFVCLLVISIFIIDVYVPYKNIVELSQSQVGIISIMTIISCMFLISFSSYCINKVNQIKIEESKINNEKNTDNQPEEIDIEKYNSLYKEILNHFDKEKPYCNPDFTISQLANAINSNTTYISKAINMNENTNFNTFINTYRVNKIKEMLKNEYQYKYTMSYIYTSAGFKHQSTFNKVFKQIEGVTPSEYIKDSYKNRKKT